MLGVPSLRRVNQRFPSHLGLFQLAIRRGEWDFLALGIEQSKRGGRLRIGRFDLANDGEGRFFPVL